MRHLPHILISTCLSGCMLSLFGDTAAGVVPDSQPTFSNPLEINNRYMPFPPGGLRVYEVKEDGLTIGVVVDIYVNETRTFEWNGAEVPCHIMESLDFQDGKLVGVSRIFLAQADDGTVYFFGDISETYINNGVVLHHGSWLVGGPTLASDPPFAEWTANPTIFMLAEPEIGDRFKREDIPPVVDETNEVIAVG
ncbi:MAG: hypothetical protein ABIH23_27540, partial [bacterium]